MAEVHTMRAAPAAEGFAITGSRRAFAEAVAKAMRRLGLDCPAQASDVARFVTSEAARLDGTLNPAAQVRQNVRAA